MIFGELLKNMHIFFNLNYKKKHIITDNSFLIIFFSAFTSELLCNQSIFFSYFNFLQPVFRLKKIRWICVIVLSERVLVVKKQERIPIKTLCSCSWAHQGRKTVAMERRNCLMVDTSLSR